MSVAEIKTTENEMILPKQYQSLFDDSYRVKIYEGGRYTLKSHSIARALLIKARQKKHRILCAREIQDSIKDSVHKLLSDLIKEYEYSDFKVTDNEIINKYTGSNFIFKGLRSTNLTDLSKTKSLEGVTITWLEEGQSISEASLDFLIPTITRVEDYELIVSMNRYKDLDPVFERYCLIPDPEVLHQYNTYLDFADFFKNIGQEKAYKQFCKEANKLLLLDPEKYNHVYKGHPASYIAGCVTRRFTAENILPLEHYSDEPLHITCDFNGDPMCWILAHKTDKEVFYFDEIVLEVTDTYAAIKYFIEKYKDRDKTQTIIINGDASGSNKSTQSPIHNYIIMRNELTKAGFRKVKIEKRKANPPIMKRVNSWNNQICNDDGERRLFINADKCKWLMYNIHNLKYKPGSNDIEDANLTQIRQDNKAKFLNHPFAAASYLVDYYWPIKTEKAA
jgi:PBSX family phage terminase large subunit